MEKTNLTKSESARLHVEKVARAIPLANELIEEYAIPTTPENVNTVVQMAMYCEDIAVEIIAGL